MSDYGELYEHPFFGALYPDFLDRQQEAASEIWARILGRCGLDAGMPAIDCIVDLGCGEGTLTVAIAKCAAKASAKRKAPIRTIGIDCSEKAINAARKNGVGLPDLSFISSGATFSELFALLQSDYQVMWDRTALVCLSHTWFHLDQDQITTAVKYFRPALCLIDIFHSWDDAIRRLNAGKTNQVLEFGRPHLNQTYWLRTIIKPGLGNKVSRGIWTLPTGSTEISSEEGAWFRPPTEQHNITTDSLFGKMDAVVNVLEASCKQGTVTGEDGCDYIRRKLLRHSSGWGEMLCHVLVARDHIAATLNKTHYAVVRTIVRRLFVDDLGSEQFSNLRSLLALYDEPPEWRAKTEFRGRGSREAAIVLPFDQHSNFARFIALFPKVNDEKIASHDLLLEVPNAAQIRFPTAYGLFHTLEDRVSSPQGFPLHWARDYDHAPIDEAFDELESDLLGIWETKNGKRETSFLDGNDPSYFLLPIYFGSLPLFTLALKFPKLFSPESTDFQVYFSALANLHAEIKITITDDLVRSELLFPWVAASLDALKRDEAKEATKPKSLEQTLELLETKLFGFVKPDGDFKKDTGLFRVEGVQRVGGVLGKEWKSWILAIPSFPIRRLRSVEADNSRLWRLWTEVKKVTLLDHELRLSHWFEKGDFFADVCHEKWICADHLTLLHRMFADAGYSGGRFEKILAWDDVWLREATAWLIASQGEDDEGETPGGYFSHSRNHFLFKWMLSQIQELQGAKTRCAYAGMNCVPPKGAEGKCSRNTEVFENLKAVFCKNLANRGDRVRFGLRRLFCLLDAASGSATIVEPKIADRSYRKYKDIESKLSSNNDPSMDIAEYVYALQRLGKGKDAPHGMLRSICVESTPVYGKPIQIKITINLIMKLCERGSDCDRVRNAFAKISRFASQKSAFGFEHYVISFEVEIKDNSILEISPTLPS